MALARWYRAAVESEAIVEPARARPVPKGALGAAAAILYVFLWASAFVPSRVLARGAPPLGILSIRFLFAGGVLVLIALALRLPIPRDRGMWLRVLGIGVGSNALYLGLSYVALRHLSAGMGSIIASTNPLILALVAPSLLGEPLTRRKLVGLVLGFSGVLLAMHARAGTQTARLPDVLLSGGGVAGCVFSHTL